jgi:hypothetical protein
LIARARAFRASMKFKGKPLDIVKLIRQDRDSH